MRKILVITILAICLAVGMTIYEAKEAKAAAVVLSLKATWTASTHNDALRNWLGFHEGSVWVGYTGPTNQPDDNFGTVQAIPRSSVPLHLANVIPLATTTVNFKKTVQDTTPIGALEFGLEVEDANGNLGIRALATYNYNVDTTPPPAVTGFTVTKQ